MQPRWNPATHVAPGIPIGAVVEMEAAEAKARAAAEAKARAAAEAEDQLRNQLLLLLK